MKKYIIAIDEGTTSTRTVLFDTQKKSIIDVISEKINIINSQAGYVEQDAEELFNAVFKCTNSIIVKHKLNSKNTYGIGITNQRETVVAWDKNTGKALYNAIVWQDKRTTEYCDNIDEKTTKYIKNNTGLKVDTYFSASKIKWLLDNCKNINIKNNIDEVCFGTIDSYLIFKLTKQKNFCTDITNASRTMLYNIKKMQWDKKLLKYFNIKESSLPKVKNNIDTFGKCVFDGNVFDICACIGDQQSSMIGQNCLNTFDTKVTFGTGGFLLTNIGEKFKVLPSLLTTIAYKINDKISYAIEGTIFSVGSLLEWAKNKLKLFDKYEDVDKLMKTTDNKNLYFYPALYGIGAPFWNSVCRTEFLGEIEKSDNADKLKAIMESIAFRVNDIISYLKKYRFDINCISVDGGVSKNDYLLDFLSSISECTICRKQNTESTALGVIFLICIAQNIFNKSDFVSIARDDKKFNSNNCFTNKVLKWNDIINKKF